jgi:hypothetical protein
MKVSQRTLKGATVHQVKTNKSLRTPPRSGRASLNPHVLDDIASTRAKIRSARSGSSPAPADRLQTAVAVSIPIAKSCAIGTVPIRPNAEPTKRFMRRLP